MVSFISFFLLLWEDAHQVVRLGEAPAKALLSHLVVSQEAGTQPTVASTLLTASTAEPMVASQMTDLMASDKSSSQSVQL